VSAKLKNEFHAKLAPVRARLGKIPRRRGAAAGLLAGALAVLLLGLIRLLLAATGRPQLPLEYFAATAGGIVAASILLGAAVGRGAGRPDGHAAARAVDARYRLQGRTISALEFLQTDDLTDWQHLQVADTMRRLGQVDPRAVVPMALPRALIYALPLLAAGAVLMILPPFERKATIPSGDDGAAQADAESAAETPCRKPEPGRPLEVGWSPAPQQAPVVFLQQSAREGPGNGRPSSSVDWLGPTTEVLPTSPLPAESARLVGEYFRAIQPTLDRQSETRPSKE